MSLVGDYASTSSDEEINDGEVVPAYTSELLNTQPSHLQEPSAKRMKGLPPADFDAPTDFNIVVDEDEVID